MLDEVEYEEIAQLHADCFQATKEFRERWGIPLELANVEERLRPVTLRYEQITGYKNCPPGAVLTHRLALLGPPCGKCGKPLRTPQAKLCGHCGVRMERAQAALEPLV